MAEDGQFWTLEKLSPTSEPIKILYPVYLVCGSSIKVECTVCFKKVSRMHHRCKVHNKYLHSWLHKNTFERHTDKLLQELIQAQAKIYHLCDNIDFCVCKKCYSSKNFRIPPNYLIHNHMLYKQIQYFPGQKFSLQKFRTTKRITPVYVADDNNCTKR